MNIRCFSSSVWADSDQEEEDEKEEEYREEDGEEKFSEEGCDDDIEGERERNYEILSAVVGKKVSKVSARVPRDLGLNYMPRFDPDAEESEAVAEVPVNGEDTSDPLPQPQISKLYDVSKNLKEAFNQPKTFSFGFNRSVAVEQEQKPTKPQLFRLDSDDETEHVEVKDFSETFGSELKGKGAGYTESFFFNSEDQRIKDAVKFFFTDRELV